MRELLANGADTDGSNVDETTALIAAARGGFEEYGFVCQFMASFFLISCC